MLHATQEEDTAAAPAPAVNDVMQDDLTTARLISVLVAAWIVMIAVWPIVTMAKSGATTMEVVVVALGLGTTWLMSTNQNDKLIGMAGGAALGVMYSLLFQILIVWTGGM